MAVHELHVRVQAAAFGGEDLVGGDSDRPDLLDRARVLADFIRCQGRAFEQLVLPLPRCHSVGYQDERCGGADGHGRGTHQRLPGPAGEHHHTAAAGPEIFGGELLVRAKLPAVLVQRDQVRCTVHVAGQVLRRPADLQEQLLELAPLGGVDHNCFAIDPWPQQRLDFLGPDDLFQYRVVVSAHHQAVLGILLQPQPSIPGHGLFDVDQQRMRHREPRVFEQRVQDLLGIQPGSACVPQAQRGEAVTVHVFRGAFQFGEGGNGVPRLGGQFMVHLEEDGFITLDDQRAVVHAGESFTGAVPLRPQCR